MRTALILLFLLALGSVPGSILPQEGSDPASVTQYFTSHPAIAPWVETFMEECSTVPNGKHDDQVDQMTQALNRLRSMTVLTGRSPLPTPRPPSGDR